MIETTEKPHRENNLAALLLDPRLARYMGRTFDVRLVALAYALTGNGVVKDLAALHGISRQKMSRHIARARLIFLGERRASP